MGTHLFLLPIVLQGALLGAPAGPGTSDPALARRLEEVRTRFQIPGVAGAYVTSEGRMVAAVAGVRRAGEKARVRLSDPFHLGSVTKPFTATLAGVLVSEGVLSYESTLGELLGERVPDMHPDHRSTTLDLLLRHRAGLQGFEEDSEFEEVPVFAGTAQVKREAFVRWLLTRPPACEPGSEHRYSNAGYSVAAAMLEWATGESWETLMETRLLKPLGIERFCFGWPVEAEEDPVWGHRIEEGAVTPHDPAADHYRLEDQYIGPAGDLSSDILGLARFARFHLRGLIGEDQLLPAEQIEFLHTPLPGDTYALGWNAYENRSTHLGSAGTFFSSVYIMRERKIALVVAANLWSEAEVEFGAALLKAVLEAAKENGDTPDE